MNELGAFLQNQPQFFGGFHFQPQNSNLITDLKSLHQILKLRGGDTTENMH